MKARVNTFLNIRTGTPEILPDNNPNEAFLKPGDEVEITDTVIGQEYKGNDIWHKLDTGNFIWNGGLDLPGTTTFNTSPATNVSIPDRFNLDWSGVAFNINKIWKKYNTLGSNARIVVLDTGFVINHPLASAKNITGWNYVGNNADFTDRIGHGSEVTSIINSFNNNLVGIAPDASIFVAKVRTGTSGIQVFIDTLLKIATFKNFDIISISYDYDPNNESFKLFEIPFHDAIVANKSKIIIASAGNYIVNTNAFPAKFPEVLAIGSIDENRNIASESNPSEIVDLSAPGVNIHCLNINDNVSFETESGTSLAAPFVAGVAALLVSYAKKEHPETPIEFWNIPDIIKKSVDPPTTNEPGYGAGIINPEKCFENLIQKFNLL